MRKTSPKKTPVTAKTPAPVAEKTRRYRGVDAGERITERRRQFIEAGLQCFGTRGYHAVPVKELCVEAGLTERYFYESFKDREALFAAVYEDLIEHLKQEFVAAAVPRAPDLGEMARAGLGVFFRSLQDDPRVARMLLVEVLTVSSEMERRAQEATFGFGDLLQKMVLAALSGLTVRDKPAAGRSPAKPVSAGADMDLLATGLIGSCVHIAMRWSAGGYDLPAKTVIETAMTFFEATIRQLGDKPASSR